VEYSFTEFGLRLLPILDAIEELQDEFALHTHREATDSQ
jgi:DNA-binding HxlR family transcriptional regulator